jgi:hypothetical protein
MYGASLLREYGETPPEMWCEAFSHMDDEAVRRGLVALLNAGGKFPPTLPQFVALALPTPVNSEWNTASAKNLLELAGDAGFRQPEPWESVAGYRTKLAMHGLTSFPTVRRDRGH